MCLRSQRKDLDTLAWVCWLLWNVVHSHAFPWPSGALLYPAVPAQVIVFQFPRITTECYDLHNL